MGGMMSRVRSRCRGSRPRSSPAWIDRRLRQSASAPCPQAEPAPAANAAIDPRIPFRMARSWSACRGGTTAVRSCRVDPFPSCGWRHPPIHRPGPDNAYRPAVRNNRHSRTPRLREIPFGTGMSGIGDIGRDESGQFGQESRGSMSRGGHGHGMQGMGWWQRSCDSHRPCRCQCPCSLSSLPSRLSV